MTHKICILYEYGACGVRGSAFTAFMRCCDTCVCMDTRRFESEARRGKAPNGPNRTSFVTRTLGAPGMLLSHEFTHTGGLL